MMQGWTKRLYEVLATDQEFKKRKELKELEEKKECESNGEVMLKMEKSTTERYLSRNSEKYAYLKNFGLGFIKHFNYINYISGIIKATKVGTSFSNLLFDSFTALLFCVGYNVVLVEIQQSL